MPSFQPACCHTEVETALLCTWGVGKSNSNERISFSCPMGCTAVQSPAGLYWKWTLSPPLLPKSDCSDVHTQKPLGVQGVFEEWNPHWYLEGDSHLASQGQNNSSRWNTISICWYRKTYVDRNKARAGRNMEREGRKTLNRKPITPTPGSTARRVQAEENVL